MVKLKFNRMILLDNAVFLNSDKKSLTFNSDASFPQNDVIKWFNTNFTLTKDFLRDYWRQIVADIAGTIHHERSWKLWNNLSNSLIDSLPIKVLCIDLNGNFSKLDPNTMTEEQHETSNSPIASADSDLRRVAQGPNRRLYAIKNDEKSVVELDPTDLTTIKKEIDLSSETNSSENLVSIIYIGDGSLVVLNQEFMTQFNLLKVDLDLNFLKKSSYQNPNFLRMQKLSATYDGNIYLTGIHGNSDSDYIIYDFDYELNLNNSNVATVNSAGNSIDNFFGLGHLVLANDNTLYTSGDGAFNIGRGPLDSVSSGIDANDGFVMAGPDGNIYAFGSRFEQKAWKTTDTIFSIASETSGALSNNVQTGIYLPTTTTPIWLGDDSGQVYTLDSLSNFGNGSPFATSLSNKIEEITYFIE